MMTEHVQSDVKLKIRNIGGIDSAEFTFEPGVTVLAGRNATNRTSLLQAIMAANGSENFSIKANADRASVEMTIDSETYERTLVRKNGTIRTSGNPYLSDATLADLFAFLLESNPARRAIVTEADLREIIMRPVDTEEIQQEIDRLLERRREVSQQLDDLDDLKRRLPSLEQERTELQEQIEETKAELQEVEAEIQNHDATVEESRGETNEVEQRLEALREKRSSLEDVRYELETEQNSLGSLRREKQEVQRELEELPEASSESVTDLESRISALRSEKQDLEAELNKVQSAIGFNEERLKDGNESSLQAVLDDDEDGGTVTDELLPDSTITCWTCGSEVEKSQIETTVETLQEVSQDLVARTSDFDDEIAKLSDRKNELQKQKRRRERLTERLKELDTEIDETQSRIETLTERRETLQEAVEALESEVTELENEAYEEVLDLHKEANQLEYDLGQLETDLERVTDNVSSIEERLGREEDLQKQHEELNGDIKDLRTRIDRIERQAIEQFNEHMEEILKLLEYNNLDRIWLKRRETEVREGRQKVTKTVFDLHVVRQTENGTSYEDTVENLSESEREVTGLIFALSGYFAHDVYETVPFMLLDSVEAIDADRIATLVEYLDGYSECLVVALLPEDAAALDEYPHLTPADR
ncbi:archaea-specific SMC-related protein [Haloarchaeobius salinus]|uniref:archaea-specific SMC-related protein n=1 Tax=Haloarchaeobius salinus TaxID=1198298 RepID=UPI00210E7F8B|nr:archaea-specific SMC-related protein [Haloarchaeobius salinus]